MTSLDYYQANAEEFIASSVGADMSGIRSRFTALLPKNAKILDLGCGSGRDALAFSREGYMVTAVDGSEELCRKASLLCGFPVRCLLFEDLDYSSEFDGVWACASLLHVPKKDMKGILQKVARALKPGGIAYISYKYGDAEREKDGRSFSDYTEKEIPELLSGTGLELVEYWISEDTRPERDEKWLNIQITNMPKKEIYEQ